jgi:hypothetical protein
MEIFQLENKGKLIPSIFWYFGITPSSPSFLPSPFMTCCAILLTSFGGKGPIWGDDWSHSPFIRRSPSWDFLGFSSAVRQMPDLWTAPRIISLSRLSLATDVTDATLRSSGLWLGTRTGAGGIATRTESFLAAAHGSMDNRSLNFGPHLSDYLSLSSFIRRSPSWGFLAFSSAVRQMPGDPCTAPRIISLLSLSLVTDTRGKWPLARNPDRSWWHRQTN